MTKSENRTHHEQEAARFRSAAEAATTPAMKALLKQKAEEHQRLIEELDGLEADTTPLVGYRDQ